MTDVTPSRTPGALPRAAVAVAVALALLVAGCTSDDDGGRTAPGADATDAPTPSEGGARPVAEVLPALGRLRVARGPAGPAVVDAEDREVLLRGANLNSLGDYHQDAPALVPTRPPTDEDWDQMAANGFSVVRLLVSWSALEPQRGQYDLAYIQRIQEAVAAAAERRIYTVIDMHQDAWSRFVASPPGVTCPPGTEPAIGWDGAPLWATLFDDADTCRPVGYREGSPAVQASFRSFYENRDGIRDAFAATWKVLASTFAGDPAVAGFDLLNEPNVVADAATSERQYTDLVNAVVGQVRAGEAEGGGFPHIIFLEPMVLYPLPGTLPTAGSPPDDQVVFAPHSYAEVIGPEILTVEQTFEVAAATAEERDWPLWIGEHGVFATDEDALDVLRRFALAQDDHLAGGAQWQWRQWCGDPHAIGLPGRIPDGLQVQLNDVSCPDDVDAGPNLELLRVAGRAYPRLAPGRLSELTSDPTTGVMRVEGRIVDDLAGGGDLVVWVPGERRPSTTGEGIAEPELAQVPGGWIVSAPVDDTPYRLEVR